MIEELKPYEALRPSGDPWLGEIPGHWAQKRLWSISSPRVERNPGNLPLLSVFLDRGVIPYGEGGGQVHAPSLDLSNYQVVYPGDFVLNNQQAWRGSVGVSRHHGIISPAYIVLRLNGELLPAYANYLFRCPRLVDQFVAASKGVGDIQRQVFWPFLRRVTVPVPSTAEQEAIVRFLDHANRRIDQFICAKKKLIALLNEQKQAIIHRTVTRGLAPSVKLKDSGVPWLGEIPSHWKILRAKHLYREVDERTTTGAEELLSVSHITGVTPRSEKNVTMFKAESYAGHKLCRPGDLVINTMWAWMAALGVSRFTGIVSPAYAVYRPLADQALVDTYADALLRIRPYVSNYIVRSTGIRASRLRLYPDQFFRVPIIVPPREEQQKIVDHFNENTAGLSSAITQADREIALIREYRTSLVADVVTGRLDVRTAAASLSDLEPATAPSELQSDEHTDMDDNEAA
ncbi:MAG: hypothetical protein R3B70_06300 [Polyangiaceae bacterium]